MKRRNMAISTALSTVILSSVLLVIVGVSSYAASNAVNFQIENSQFDQAKNILLALSQVIKKVMFISHSSGYVRCSFLNTIPQFVKASGYMTLTINSEGGNWTYTIPVNVIRIKGGRFVGVLTPRNLLGDNSLLLTNVSSPLGRVYTFQSDGAWVALDYMRARCVYMGTSDYFNGTGYERFNVVEITLVNLTFGIFEPETQAYITSQNLGIEADPPIQVSGNFTIKVNLTSTGEEVSCSLTDLGGNPEYPTLVNLVFINIEVSILKGG